MHSLCSDALAFSALARCVISEPTNMRWHRFLEVLDIVEQCIKERVKKIRGIHLVNITIVIEDDPDK